MEDLHALIESMFYMVKSIMTVRVSDHDVKMADFHIKLFLTRLVECNKKINPDAKVPFWISSYIYPCLLNLPAHMKEFGPLKNLWEGGVRGEGFLPYVKHEHGTIGLRQGCPIQVMKRIHQKKGLRAMGSSMENDDLSDDENMDDKDIENVCNSFWAYPDENVVFNDFRNNGRISLHFSIYFQVWPALLY